MRTEKAELGIRLLIAIGLRGDASKIPSHVEQKLNERIKVALAKSPGLDKSDFEELERRLEYADQRELEAILTNSGTWPLFQHWFVNKENLNQKFNQLAELRNGIRHTRTVGEVARKEGEAAIIWFEEVLRKEK